MEIQITTAKMRATKKMMLTIRKIMKTVRVSQRLKNTVLQMEKMVKHLKH